MWTNRIIKREAVVKTRYTRDLESTTLIDRLFIGYVTEIFIYLFMYDIATHFYVLCIKS